MATQLPLCLLVRFSLKCIADAARMIFPQAARFTLARSIYE
jgi:hypothetical protein